MPNATAASQRQKELTALLRKAADAYYNDDIEIMSNYEYDALYDELVALEEESGVTLDGSVTSSVGSDVEDASVTGLVKVHHATPMLSLNKTKDRDSLVGWLGDHTGCLSWKLDGSTVVISYEGGTIKQAVTRGNGQIGEDITAQARKFAFVPETIPFDGKLVVRGEALMTYSEFERVNALQPDTAKYKNPRNLASGTMRQLDLSILDERTVEFHPFELISMTDGSATIEGKTLPMDVREDGTGLDAHLFSNRLDILSDLGFSPVEHHLVHADTVVDMVDEMEKSIRSNDFPTDGLVLQYDDVAYGHSLGTTGHHPRSGIALKWADDTYETTLKDIDWYGSRTGRLNPVAIFEPVDMDGVTVTKASLHNVTYVRDLALGIGDTITVYRANEVIPQVAENLTRSLSDVSDILPSTCPICGGPVSLHRDHDSDVLYCENPDCIAKNVKRLAHFVSRDALNVMGLSDERIEDLVDAGVVKSFSDILDLPNRRDDIVGKVGNIQERGFENLVRAIETARHTEAMRVLYSFGIREVGRSASRDICRHYNNDLRAIIADAKAGLTDKFTAIGGVGPIMAGELVSYVQANCDSMLEVIDALDVTDENTAGVPSDGNGFVTGKTFVITGSVHRFKNRSEFKKYVEGEGGKVSGSVSKNTDYLVTNTPDSGTGKNKKAKELGIAVITEDEFCDKAGIVA